MIFRSIPHLILMTFIIFLVILAGIGAAVVFG